MAITNNPRGFVEFRHLGGGCNPKTHMYRARQTSQGSPAVIRAGDPVCFVSGNRVARIPSDSSATGCTPILGVVRACYSNTGGNRGQAKPKTFSLPGAAPVIGQAEDGWVEVNIDPFQTYLVNCDTTATDTGVGMFFGTTVHAVGTTQGRSGFGLEIGTVTAAPSLTCMWQVVDFSPLENDRILTPAGGLADLNADYEVKIAVHAFNAPFSFGSAGVVGSNLATPVKDAS